MVLDSSGSMQVQPWKDLCNAFNNFISVRQNTNANDVVSIIVYDSNAKLQCEAIPLQSNFANYLVYSGGGTDFGRALQCANQVISRNDHKRREPVLIFLSDGEHSSGLPEMSAIYKSYSVHNLKVFVIGFCSSGETMLRRLAVAGGGIFLTSSNGIQLQSTFEEISSTIKIVSLIN